MPPTAAMPRRWWGARCITLSLRRAVKNIILHTAPLELRWPVRRLTRYGLYHYKILSPLPFLCESSFLFLFLRYDSLLRNEPRDISTPKLSPHLSKTRQRTVLARIQPQLLFIPSHSSRTLRWGMLYFLHKCSVYRVYPRP